MAISPDAGIGYVGWVRFDDSDYIRATSADLKATQAIDKPDVVDGKFDKTVYQLKPVEVGGSIQFPAVYEIGIGVGSETPSDKLWKYAVARQESGLLLKSDVNVDIKYQNGVGFKYTGNIIDAYEWSITQGETLNINATLLGKNRVPFVRSEETTEFHQPMYRQRSTRAITWNDITIGMTLSTGQTVPSETIRSFKANVANNATRYYTLNGSLAPALILPGKRDITGTITLVGRNPDLGHSAYGSSTTDNRGHCTAGHSIEFGYSTSSFVETVACPSHSWAVDLSGMCIFEIEEMAISNSLFETTVKWHALPGIAFEGTDTADMIFLKQTP
jgi:hypothetical protein